jgi:hypothetical protein
MLAKILTSFEIYKSMLQLFSPPHALCDDVGTAVEPQSAGIEDQVVVVGICPATPRILEVVVAAAFVHLLDALLGSLSGEVIFVHDALHGILTVGGNEDAEDFRVATKHPVGTAADDDAGFAHSQGADDTALADKDGVVVGRIHGHGDALVGEDELPQLAVADILLILTHKLRGVAEPLGSLVDNVVVVVVDTQLLGQHLAQCQTTAAIFARDGDDKGLLT